MKRTEGSQGDSTRHQIVRVNLLRSASRVVETVVGARRADEVLESYKRHLTPAEIAKGDSYAVKSCSAIGTSRRMSGAE